MSLKDAIARESLFVRGSLDMCILALLNQEPLHAYGIVQRLADYGFQQSSYGTVYPLVSRLRRQGLLNQESVPSPDGPARHVLSLTKEGEQTLARWSTQWQVGTQRVRNLLNATVANSTGRPVS